MPDYVLLMKLTDEGARDIADAPHRIEQAAKLWEALGGEFHTVCLTLGEYDYVALGSARDDETAARFALRLCQQGTVTTTTLRAFRDEALTELFESAFPSPPPTYPTMHKAASAPPE